MAKYWFLGAIFHNGSFVPSARNGSDGTTRKSDSDTNFNSIHDKRTTILWSEVIGHLALHQRVATTSSAI